jgi:hypothetical protein
MSYGRGLLLFFLLREKDSYVEKRLFKK